MSIDLSGLLNTLLDGEHLGEDTARDLLTELTGSEIQPALSGALLAALRSKGETAAEIRGFARAMRELAVAPSIPDGAPTVDTVGTGGDGSGTYNLSTGTGLLAAAAGLRVVKHGNRSISSRSGSADVLEELGLPLPLTGGRVGDCLTQTGFTFLFAPAFHPAMKSIAPVRAAMGVRTVFNLLGPLTNPAVPPYQLIGAFSMDAAELMADTLSGMPIERAFVVHGEPGWDEATPAGQFELFDVRPGSVRRERRDPADAGLKRCDPGELRGGDAALNAAALRAVFHGEDRGPHRDALTLGAGLVLELTGQVRDLAAGVVRAGEVIDDGAAERTLSSLAHFGRERADG